MKLIQAYNEIQKLNKQLPEYPWHVWSILLGRKFKPEITSDTICLAPEGDHCSLEDAQKAVQYLVEQLGGKVVWQKVNTIKKENIP